VRYFPPRGGVEAGPDGGWWWFPVHLLLDQLGGCSVGGCEAAAVYIVAAAGSPGHQICLPTCAEQACDTARIIDGHEHCPQCQIQWVGPPEDLTADHLAQALTGKPRDD
jgi:hypothetical protein